MKHTKQMLAAGVLSAAVLSGGAFALSASAQNSNGDDTLASKIATKFNLNKEEVQSVLNEDRAEHWAEHQADHLKRHEEMLTKAVVAGEITEDQKTKILDFLKSQDINLQNLEDKSEEERKVAFDAHREEVKKWAQDNGIDEKYVLPGGGMGHGPGHMGMRGGSDSENN